MKSLNPGLPSWNPNYTRCCSVFLSLFFISLVSKGQCIPTGVQSPGTIVSDNGVGTLSFSNPIFASASDANRASATLLVSLSSVTSHYLKATGFGFSILSNASICGVVVEFQKSAGGLGIGASIQDNQIRLLKGGTPTASNLANTGVNWSGTESYHSYGSTTELWGTTLTPADVNSANFGIAISSNITSGLGVFPSSRVNHVRMTVYYEVPLPTHIISFSSRLRNNNVLLEWKTADEEDGEIITVQRTLAGHSQWADIARFDMHTGNMGKTYSYTDPLTEKGNYSYRLQITNNNAVNIYSATKHVSYEGHAVLTAYPNPASDFISIDNVKDPQSLFISNLSMQSFKLPVQLMGNNSVRIDTRSLPGGLYFASSGAQRIKFIKQ